MPVRICSARPPSVINGRIHLDTRFDTLGLETDVALAPLSFEGIRRAFPTLRARGDLRGRFVSAGTLVLAGINQGFDAAINFGAQRDLKLGVQFTTLGQEESDEDHCPSGGFGKAVFSSL